MKQVQVHRKAFGKFLIGLRANANLTQNDVSEVLGYKSPQFVSNIERGISVMPLDMGVKLAKVYNVPVEKVITKLNAMEAAITEEKVKAITVPKKLLEKAATRRKLRAKEMNGKH